MLKGQPNFDAIELFEKHVEEFRDKVQTLKDIRRVIIANLNHIDASQARQNNYEMPAKEESSSSCGESRLVS